MREDRNMNGGNIVQTCFETFMQIYDMQAILNRQYINRDTLNPPDQQTRIEWTLDYLVALHDEITELYNCFRWKWWDTKVKNDQNYRFEIFDLENAKIEFVDILHFFVSLCHLWCDGQDDLKEIAVSLLDTKQSYFERCPDEYKFITTLQTIPLVGELMRRFLSLKINKSTSINNDEVVVYLIQIAGNLGMIASFLGMTKDQIFEIYKRKWEVNVQRQNHGYTMDNKTEDDNIKLAGQISSL